MRSALEIWNKRLPSTFSILGIHLAGGIVFLTKDSAEQWLREKQVSISSVEIIETTVMYCPSNQAGGLQQKTTEDIVAERNKGLDMVS